MEVKNHWMRILILISYFFLVFIVLRLLDLVLWYHRGYLPTDIVDPIVLNVRQLKLLLDSRGVSYTGVLEKQQLVQLLNDSAHVVKSQVDELSGFSNTSDRLSPHKTPPSTLFTGGPHFNEKVEDAKDSVWLVQVLPASKRKEPLLDDYSWQLLKHQLAPFAIQTGVFDCAMDRALCVGRNWLEPILLLALPRGNRPKDHIIIRTSNTPKINMIVKWVKDQLSSRVTKISSLSQLEDQWLRPSPSDDSVRVVLISHLLHTPLFFAALSIKFSGRIKFGMFTARRDQAPPSSTSGGAGAGDAQFTASSGGGSAPARGAATLPLYLVVTPGGTFQYGRGPAQHPSLLHLNLFLRLVVPEVNDLFLLALLLTNMLAVLDVCQLQGVTLWHYLARTSCLVVTYNLLLFLLSLLLYSLSSPPLPLSALLSLLRALNCSHLGALIRSDLLRLHASPLSFTGSFLLYGFLMGRRFPRRANAEWTLLGNSFILNSLFRPSERPTFTSDVHFELRFEQFVLRGAAPRALNVPNLWLQAAAPRVDYLSDLPVFEYRGWRPCPHKEVDVLIRVMDGETRPACLVAARGRKAAAGVAGDGHPAALENGRLGRRTRGDAACTREGSADGASSIGSRRLAGSDPVSRCPSLGGPPLGRRRMCSQLSYEQSGSAESDTVCPHANNSGVSLPVISDSELAVHKRDAGSNSSSQNPSPDHSSRKGSGMSRSCDSANRGSAVTSVSKSNPDRCPCEITTTNVGPSGCSCRISETLESSRCRQRNSMSSSEDRGHSMSPRENVAHSVTSSENRANSVSSIENGENSASSIEDRTHVSTSRERENSVSLREDRENSVSSREDRTNFVSSIEDRTHLSPSGQRENSVSSREDRENSVSTREDRRNFVTSIEDRTHLSPSGERENYVSSREDRENSVSSREDRTNFVTSIEDRTHVSPSRERENSVSSREDRNRSFTTDTDRAEDTEGCDYLECRLIRTRDCAICLEAYVPRAILLALPCAHHFHKACVLAWLQRGHPQCPVCRWPAYKQKYEFSY